MTRSHQNSRHIFSIALLVTFMLTLGLVGHVNAQPPKPMRVWILLDISQSIKTNSLSDIPLFIIKYFQVFYPGKVEVAFVAFGKTAVTIFEPTVVSKITSNSFAKSLFRLPEADNGESIFTTALRQVKCENVSISEPCYVLFLSDGYYTDENRGLNFPKELQEYSKLGYKIFLAQDTVSDWRDADGKLVAPSVKNTKLGIWDQHAFGMLNTSVVKTKFYAKLFEKVGFPPPSAPVDCKDLHWIIRPDQKNIKISLIKEQPFLVKWFDENNKEISPNLFTDFEYGWEALPPGKLSARIEPSPDDAPDSPCWVYEKYEYAKSNYILSTEIKPVAQAVGEPVEFRAWISDVSNTHAIGEGINIYVYIDKNKIRLNGPDDNGVFSLSKDDIPEGNYDHIRFEGTYQDNRIVSKDEKHLVVGRIPSLELKVEDKGNGAKRVVVVVDNFDVIPRENHYLNMNADGNITKLTDYHQNHRQATFDLIPDTSLVSGQKIIVELPAGRTVNNIPYNTQRQEYHQQSTIPLFVWLLFGVVVVSLVLFLILLWMKQKNQEGVSVNIGEKIAKIEKIRSDVFEGQGEIKDLVEAIGDLNQYGITAVPKAADEIKKIANEIAKFYAHHSDQPKAGILKEKLIEKAKEHRNAGEHPDCVLVILLSALFLSCEENPNDPNDTSGVMDEMRVLYQHLFKGELKEFVFSPGVSGNNNLAIKPLSAPFLDSYKTALDNHRCAHGKSCPSKKIWQANYHLLKFLYDLEHPEKTDIRNVTDELNNICSSVSKFLKNLERPSQKKPLPSIYYCGQLSARVNRATKLNSKSQKEEDLYKPVATDFVDYDPDISGNMELLEKMFSLKISSFVEYEAKSSNFLGNLSQLPVLEYKLIEQIIRIGFPNMFEELKKPRKESGL